MKKRAFLALYLAAILLITSALSCVVGATSAGDVNGDGVINGKDLTRLKRYLAGDEVAVTELMPDTNGDGAINNKDLTRLMRYLAGTA